MSVTVSDILKLPSMRDARVSGGESGLGRIVDSVSVLEYAQPSLTLTELFDNIEFMGNELVITAFATIKDDVEAQCANIRSMSEVGEVGMILYYVGIIMPSVDQRLVKLADELDFVLICMPENEPDIQPDFTERFADEESALRIHRFLHGMDEPYKEVFSLRVFGELPFEKIGAIFGKSSGWARVTFYRAKKQIIEYMEVTEHEEDKL